MTDKEIKENIYFQYYTVEKDSFIPNFNNCMYQSNVHSEWLYGLVVMLNGIDNPNNVRVSLYYKAENIFSIESNNADDCFNKLIFYKNNKEIQEDIYKLVKSFGNFIFPHDIKYITKLYMTNYLLKNLK